MCTGELSAVHDEGVPAVATTALLTDHYELTMLQAALADGLAERECVFEVFCRSLAGRRYGMFAGVARLAEAIEELRFESDTLEFLTATGVVNRSTADWLAGYRFTGSLDAYAEGEVFFPGSPVAVVQASFAEAVLLETLVLSILNFDSAVATAASRMVTAAAGRPLIEMGARRTHEQAAVAAARAAYLAGFAATSNLAAGRRWSVPTAGTAAHAFTLLHDSEAAAFRAQVASLGPATTLLVDTYDVPGGIEAAVRAAGTALGAIRLDSGDLPALAVQARAQLDALGALDTRIVVTSDLDEHSIAALAVAPVDGYGVGTAVVTGSGVPTSGLVYKLVARAGRAGLVPVAKTSAGKLSRPGRKWASRGYDQEGTASVELVHLDGPPEPDAGARTLQVPVFRAGRRVEVASLAAAREHAAQVRAELPPAAFALSAGEPALPVRFVGRAR